MARATLKPGVTHKDVPEAKVLTQRWLRSYRATALASRINEVSKTYGVDAQKGVKYVQTKHKLVADGIIGPKTWAVLLQKATAPKKVLKPAVQYDGRRAGKTHGTHTPVRIVLHDTESHDQRGIGDIKGVLGYLSRTPDGLNAHLVVDSEGYTGQGADFSKLCYHAAGGNTGSIGIEQIGFARFSMLGWWRRKAQLETVAKWLAYLSKTYGIPLVHSTEHGVCMHKDLPQGGHHDPGAGYPFHSVLARAQALKASGW